MEIEFNTGNVGKPDPGKPVRRESVRPAADDPSFDRTHALEEKLKDIPLVRREKVERAKSLVSDMKYPPDEMLVGIANLLAMEMKKK